MRLRYTRPALDDLDAILDYIAARSPQGAGCVHARIESAINLLLPHPRIGAKTEDPTIRRISVSPYPYLIFYEVTENEIIIHAVRHAARKPSGMPGSP
jgi:toxin ParE1/3/4